MNKTRAVNKLCVLAALLAGACSSEPAATPLQQRIVELETQNAQLQRDLQKAQGDVAALQKIMNSNQAINNGTADEAEASDSSPGQPTMPQPSNNLGGAATPSAG